jgi:hypothetical protein
VHGEQTKIPRVSSGHDSVWDFAEYNAKHYRSLPKAVMSQTNKRKQQAPSRSRQQNSPKIVPLSQRLMELADPLSYEGIPLNAYQIMITFAAVAWNFSLFPVEKRPELLINYIKRVGSTFDELTEASSNTVVTETPDINMNLAKLLKALIHRKETLFPDDRRYLQHQEVVEDEDGSYRVKVGYRPSLDGE